MVENLNCSPDDIRLKSNFLGPKSEASEWLEKNVNYIFSNWCDWRRERFPSDGQSISEADLKHSAFKEAHEVIYNNLTELTKRFEKEVPKYSPRYMGHMVSEISLPALFGHLIALVHNPNNSSFSASKVGLEIEKEAIKELAHMVGYTNSAQGHFTSGGTIANFEGLWRARFRLDHCLSLGAYLRKEGASKLDIFKSAHTSITYLRDRVGKENIQGSDFKQYSFVLEGPYTIQSKYKKIFRSSFLGPVLIVPGHKHYSWQKALSVMGLGEEALWSVEINKKGHLCLDDLKKKIEKAKALQRPILAVVSVTGTTELGMVDPVDDVQDLLNSYKEKENIHIWHHVDGAYGGIYCSLLRGKEYFEYDLSPKVKLSLNTLKDADSITLDPHKLALVPYSCGAIIVKDVDTYQVSEFKAPYLKENKSNSGKWNSTLEGSRSATGAAATWMVAKSIGFNRNGLGRLLSMGLVAKEFLSEALGNAHPYIKLIPNSDTNIIAFAIANEGESTSFSNKRTNFIYEEICNEEYFSVSKTSLTQKTYDRFIHNWIADWNGDLDTPSIDLIRMVMMNPFTVSKENSFNYLGDFSSYITNKINNYSEIKIEENRYE